MKITLSSGEISQIEKDTQNQAKGSGFFTHRAGRIGASLSGAVCHTNPAQPSQSLIKSICYPHLFKINTKAVTYGCKHEDDAIKAYEEIMAMTHTDFKISKCGLVKNQEYPWIHATPDLLVSCSCCGLGCGEIKCPFCTDKCDFHSYVLKRTSCLERVCGEFQLKEPTITLSKSNNNCLHCQNEITTTLWFVLLTVTTVPKL